MKTDRAKKKKEHKPTQTEFAKTAERFVEFLEMASFQRRLGSHPALAGTKRI